MSPLKLEKKKRLLSAAVVWNNGQSHSASFLDIFIDVLGRLDWKITHTLVVKMFTNFATDREIKKTKFAYLKELILFFFF